MMGTKFATINAIILTHIQPVMAISNVKFGKIYAAKFICLSFMYSLE